MYEHLKPAEQGEAGFFYAPFVHRYADSLKDKRKLFNEVKS
jgi:hypothetical protein